MRCALQRADMLFRTSLVVALAARYGVARNEDSPDSDGIARRVRAKDVYLPVSMSMAAAIPDTTFHSLF